MFPIPSPTAVFRGPAGVGALAGKRAVITGGDSGIGPAVAIAFARETAGLIEWAGSAIINTSSIQAFAPSPQLLDYATTKTAIANFTKALALNLAARGIRVNAVAPGPIWTPLIPATMPPEKVKQFGTRSPATAPGRSSASPAASRRSDPSVCRPVPPPQRGQTDIRRRTSAIRAASRP